VGRKKAAAAAARTGNTKLGMPAARTVYYAAPENWCAAKDWIVISPDGFRYEIKNLCIWMRKHLGDDEGRRVTRGLYIVKRSILGKTKRTVGFSHGWTLHDDMFCKPGSGPLHDDCNG
jgi:hypothetical protein